MVFLSFALLAVDDIHAAATPLVMVDPKVIGAAPTESFSVNIMVVNVTNMYAWQFNMTYDPAILEALNVVEGPFLKQFRTTMMTSPAINETAGWVFASDAFFDWQDVGANGSGVLAVASFRVKAAGVCSLHFSRETTTLLTFDGSLPVDMAYEPRDGVFGYPRDLAVTGLSASDSSVRAGELVSLDATVRNNGVVDEVFSVIFYRNSTIIGAKNDVSLDSQASTSVVFVWNTTGVAAGNYVMKAEIAAVSGESATANNVREGGVVTIELVHDVAITKVMVSSSSVSSGGTVSINVTVINKGSASETFNIAVSYNNTVIETKELGLVPGDSGILTFIWETRDVAPGIYILTAATSTIPGETSTADNVYSNVALQVTSASFVLPLEWLAVIAVVVIVVLALAIFLYMKRRSKKT